jgi:tetratricopeptide (TPR) repeat protein
MSSGKSQGLGFDGWMNKLKTEFGNPAGEEAFDPNAPMDDLAKMRRLMAIDRRYMYATMAAHPGRSTEATVKELNAIARDYEQLLQAGAPQRFFKENDVRGKIADAISVAARACTHLHQYQEAAKLYRSAADIYKQAGKPEEVKRCMSSVAELKYPQDGNVDAEILRLQAKIAKAGANSIDQADALIELGALYGGNGDDHEARKLLEKAETILKMHAPDPKGADLANALTASIMGIAAGQPAGLSGIEDTMRVQGLYRLLYVALARAYQTTNPKKAEEYRSKAAQRDSREVNDDFSQTMLQMLKGDLGKLL